MNIPTRLQRLQLHGMTNYGIAAKVNSAIDEFYLIDGGIRENIRPSISGKGSDLTEAYGFVTRVTPSFIKTLLVFSLLSYHV